MLRSTWAVLDARDAPARERDWRIRERGTRRRTWRERVSFGGVVFELLSERALAHELERADQRYWLRGADPRAIADVVCSVHVDAVLPDAPEDNRVRTAIDEASGHGIVRARGLSAELAAVGARRYAAAARIGPDPESVIGLLRALTSAVVQREGGLMMHAAAVEIDGEAVLFLGPSGAGRSTAARHSEGARCFAHDHVALVPAGGRWLAWGLPGGKPAGAELASDVAYPVAAALRVHESRPPAPPRAAPLRGAPALFALRESVECAEVSAGAEDRYLHAATRLAARIAVGTLHTAIDRQHGDVLRAFLREASGRSGARSS